MSDISVSMLQGEYSVVGEDQVNMNTTSGKGEGKEGPRPPSWHAVNPAATGCLGMDISGAFGAIP